MKISSFLCLCILLLSACSKVEPVVIVESKDPAYLKRGASLVRGLASCGFCHGETASPSSPLIGGRSYADILGEVKAANLTPAESGLGAWEVKDYVQALRSSIDKDGNTISVTAHRGFEWLSDRDLHSIIAYLRSMPAIENEVERREVELVLQYTKGLLEKRREVSGYVPEIAMKNRIEYGKYLVDHVARCGVCHNGPDPILGSPDYLSGGSTINRAGKEAVAPNITNSKTEGIGDWTEEQIVTYLKTGKTAKDEQIDSKFCPVNFYAQAVEEDLKAIAKYLKTVVPE